MNDHQPTPRWSEYPTPVRQVCAVDGFDWPCDAAALLIENERLRRALDLAAPFLHIHGWVWPEDFARG